MHKLEADLREISRVRDTQAKARQRSRLHRVAIVGYTNAGKSTLLNHLTDAGVLVEDRLFATLDATTRRLQLPGGESVLLTDTVGFITKLPTQLVEAFKSTLEVVVDADLLVHVVDGSAADPESNIEAVDRVLNEIGAADVPQMLVVNKIDIDPDGAKEVLEDHPGCVALSARTGEGVADMLRALADRLRGLSNITELLVPFDRGDLLAALHREGEVLVETATEGGMLVRARLDEVSVSRLHEFVVSDQTLRS
jgi:GTP-binding protein HflX